jgi:hypothetical protein
MTTPSWVPGQEIKPAPMPLLLVQSFVNTSDGGIGSDLRTSHPAAGDRRRPACWHLAPAESLR